MAKKQKTPLSANLRDFIDIVHSLFAELARAPTSGDIQRVTGWASPNSVTYRVRQLRELGLMLPSDKSSTGFRTKWMHELTSSSENRLSRMVGRDTVVSE